MKHLSLTQQQATDLIAALESAIDERDAYFQDGNPEYDGYTEAEIERMKGESERWRALIAHVTDADEKRNVVPLSELPDDRDLSIVGVETCYSGGNMTPVELPDGKTWKDVESWYVKWGTFFYKLRGEAAWREEETAYLEVDQIDLKRPAEVSVYTLDEDACGLEVIDTSD